MPITNALSNVHNNPIPQVYCFATNLSTYYCADLDVFSDEMIYSYDLTQLFPMGLFVFQGSKLHICINISTNDLKAPSTPLNGSSSSFIRAINTPFSLSNIYKDNSSVNKSSQCQSSKIFPENYIVFEGKNLLSKFENKSLKCFTTLCD